MEDLSRPSKKGVARHAIGRDLFAVAAELFSELTILGLCFSSALRDGVLRDQRACS